MSHSIRSAMERGELTEEEAYFVLRFAGHIGYDKAIRRLQPSGPRFRRWFIHLMGWEPPALSQWDRGCPKWDLFHTIPTPQGEKRVLTSPCPVSLFGGRVVCFGWGTQLKLFGGYLVASRDYANGFPTKLYWSPDGTPQHPRARMFAKRRRAVYAKENSCPE